MPTLANKQFNFSNYIRSYICTVIVCKVFAQIMLAKFHCGVRFRYIFASMLSNILYVQFIHFSSFLSKNMHIFTELRYGLRTNRGWTGYKHQTFHRQKKYIANYLHNLSHSVCIQKCWKTKKNHGRLTKYFEKSLKNKPAKSSPNTVTLLLNIFLEIMSIKRNVENAENHFKN